MASGYQPKKPGILPLPFPSVAADGMSQLEETNCVTKRKSVPAPGSPSERCPVSRATPGGLGPCGPPRPRAPDAHYRRLETDVCLGYAGGVNGDLSCHREVVWAERVWPAWDSY